jgi:rRNA-processing protein FCF1
MKKLWALGLMAKFYLDACIWRDYYENRSDKFRPLGEWAIAFLNHALETDALILISDAVLSELERYYDTETLKLIMEPFKGSIRFVSRTRRQSAEAAKMCKERKVPFGDALHAIVARDEKAVLVSRDRHFFELVDVVQVRAPEELI